MKNVETNFNFIKSDMEVFINYLKAKYPFFHNSNFFFRDLQYGVRSFLEKKEIDITYKEAEAIANKIGEYLESTNAFIRVNSRGWRINMPGHVTAVPGDPF